MSADAAAVRLRPMDEAPKDRRILFFYADNHRFSIGEWLAAEHAGKGVPFWASDRIHVIGIAICARRSPWDGSPCPRSPIHEPRSRPARSTRGRA